MVGDHTRAQPRCVRTIHPRAAGGAHRLNAYPRSVPALPDVGLAALPAEAPGAASYRRLLRTRGFKPLFASTLLGRTATQFWAVAIVLFALQRYHAPSVAGLSVFLLIFPGLLLSPITGALLDRFGRRRMMVLDFMAA